MIVYVVTFEPDHANGYVVGVAKTLDAAKAAAQREHSHLRLEWTEHAYRDGSRGWSCKPYRASLAAYEIEAHEVIEA